MFLVRGLIKENHLPVVRDSARAVLLALEEHDLERIGGRTRLFGRKLLVMVCAASRAKLDACAVRNDPIQLLDFRIRHGDAAGGPIKEEVRAADPTKAVVNPVNHDLTARIVAGRIIPLRSLSVRVGSLGIAAGFYALRRISDIKV